MGQNLFLRKKVYKVIVASFFLQACQIECTLPLFRMEIRLQDNTTTLEVNKSITQDETKVLDYCVLSHSVFFFSMHFAVSDWFIDQYKMETADCKLQTQAD